MRQPRLVNRRRWIRQSKSGGFVKTICYQSTHPTPPLILRGCRQCKWKEHHIIQGRRYMASTHPFWLLNLGCWIRRFWLLNLGWLLKPGLFRPALSNPPANQRLCRSEQGSALHFASGSTKDLSTAQKIWIFKKKKFAHDTNRRKFRSLTSDNMDSWKTE